MAQYDERQLYCTNGQRTFLMGTQAGTGDAPAEPIWSWTPQDSGQIPSMPNHKFWFVGLGECKPVLDGSAILMSSSWGPGGVCMIRRSDKACLFYAHGPNGHSAELIGDNILAAVFSDRCDRLRLYRLDRNPLAATPAWEMELPGGHGVVWDRKRQVLWALGSPALLKLKVDLARVTARVVDSWTLDHPSGHDLFPLDEGSLAVTHDAGGFRFDIARQRFGTLGELSCLPHIKSLSRSPRGEITYTVGEPVFTRTIHIVGRKPIILPPMALYKVRWNVHNEFSY